MKKIKLVRLMCVSLAALCLAAPVWARHNKNVLHEDVVVPKGQTMTGDISTDKSITVDGILLGNAVSLGGDKVKVTGEVTGDVSSMGGDVEIAGLVTGDVVSMGGNVNVAGKVTGTISSMGGDVILDKTADVTGEISSLGGDVKKAPGSKHSGSVNSLGVGAIKRMLPRIIKLAQVADGDTGRWGNKGMDMAPWLAGGLIGLGLVVLFSLFFTSLLSLLIPAVFFPKNVEAVAAEIKRDFWRSAAIGAGIIIAVLPVLLMMIVSILGIPLVPLAILLFIAAMVLGMSSFSVVLQGRFFEGIKKAGPAGLVGKVCVGCLLMGALIVFGKLLPFVGGLLTLTGLIVLSLGTVVGLGAVLSTRMGSGPKAAPAAGPAFAAGVPVQAAAVAVQPPAEPPAAV